MGLKDFLFMVSVSYFVYWKVLVSSICINFKNGGSGVEGPISNVTTLPCQIEAAGGIKTSRVKL